MTRDEAVGMINAVTRTCRGPLAEGARENIDALLQVGAMEAAARLDGQSRQGCGYDFNKIIAKGPLDGSEVQYTCPKCKVKGTYRAPKF